MRSKKPKKTKSWKIEISLEALTRVAPKLIGETFQILTEGYKLQRSSGLWKRSNGSLTARLVYRATDPSATLQSHVITVRNITLERQPLQQVADG